MTRDNSNSASRRVAMQACHCAVVSMHFAPVLRVQKTRCILQGYPLNTYIARERPPRITLRNEEEETKSGISSGQMLSLRWTVLNNQV
ncbi:hypothetical protein Pdw03_3134 [Penicillium digitatum]|uniref:Uncharacterized protein n=1 Tax=Penicillium digitatum TaxID=36651 RepID=A0A7T7BHT6_PENDI|nr:hypothetical protein Pdw03_3134 [Penicillium digitatum]